MHSRFHSQFKFLDWQLDIATFQLKLSYFIEGIGRVSEVLTFPEFPSSVLIQRKKEIEKACELIHLMCGVSYYKSGMAERVNFEKAPLQLYAEFVKKTWKHGLAELAYQNKISLKNRMLFDYQDDFIGPSASTLGLAHKSLVALGGGKDSLVTVEELKSEGKDINLFMVGNSQFIIDMASFIDFPLLRVQRKIDNKLIEYNKMGAINGHVPITAINSVIGILVALLYDFNEIVFSNENSADIANTVNQDGDEVNHQYSKSYQFEQDIQKVIHSCIATDLHYYSKQRKCSELAILKKFASYPQYFNEFSSCNRNFHISGSKNKSGKWCCQCPKCRFVFLGLAPFVEKQVLLEIFAVNILNDESQKQGYQELLGLKGIKPFECVGTIEESRLAFNLLKTREEWQTDKLIREFSGICPESTDEQFEKLMSCIE